MHAYEEREQVVKEKFRPIGVSSLDSKNRITLGSKVIKETPLNNMQIDAFEILIGDEGDILLKPTTNIPSRELWIYQNLDVLKHMQNGLRDAQDGKIKEAKNLKKFLKNL
jgi:hypothetical protein